MHVCMFNSGLNLSPVFIHYTSLSATGITRCSAWVNLGNINYAGIKYQQEYITLCTLGTKIGHSTGTKARLHRHYQLKKRKGSVWDNIEKYVEKK
jgi:hypothetical protein